MRVIHVVDSLAAGGAEKIAVDLSKYLLYRNLKVSLLVLRDHPGLEEPKGVNIHRLKKVSNYRLGFYIKARKILTDYDIVHVHGRGAYKFVFIALVMSRMSQRVILHDHYGNVENYSKAHVFSRQLLKSKNYIAVSSKLYSLYCLDTKLVPYRHLVLSNVLLAIKKDKLFNARVKGKTDCINIGNIKHIKNQQFFIDLCVLSGKQGVIVGAIQNDAYFRNLLPTPNIEYIHNATSGIDILNEINPKVGIHCSYSESGPLVLLEFAACGLPFLTFDTGEIAKKVKEVLPELVLNSWDLEEWQERLDMIMMNYPYYSMRVRNFYNSYNDAENYVDQIYLMYEDIYKEASGNN